MLSRRRVIAWQQTTNPPDGCFRVELVAIAAVARPGEAVYEKP
jgi:hypothetical protein